MPIDAIVEISVGNNLQSYDPINLVLFLCN